MAVNCSEILLNNSWIAVELPIKVADILRPLGGMSHTAVIPQSRSCSYSGCPASARPPPSWTFGHGRRRQQSDICHALGHRLPLCSWHRTSVESAQAQREPCIAGCLSQSKGQNQA